MTLLSGVLALWNYHLAPVSAQICNKENTSALCVYWRVTHHVNSPTFGTTYKEEKLMFQAILVFYSFPQSRIKKE